MIRGSAPTSRNRTVPVDLPPIAPFVGQDPPNHDRLRRIAMSQFGPPGNPGLVLQCEPEIRRLVDEKIDALQPGPIDVVDDFAYPIPVAVICQLLGVAPSDEPRFHAWADTIVESIDPGDQPNAEELTRKGHERDALPSSAISASWSLSTAPTRPTRCCRAWPTHPPTKRSPTSICRSRACCC